MPRQSRMDAPGTLHHVIGRGIEGTKIFRNRADREDFLDRLAKLCEAKALSIYAWALLGTHFHLLVRSGNQSLSRSISRLLTGYVVNFNRRHKRYGHLFQNRYKSILCEEDPYLLELTRYIHLNPLRARMVKNFKELGFYPWSGHSAIMGRQKRGWQDVGTVLGYYGRRKRRAIAAYEDYVREGIEKGRRPELVGGGLIRSLGGWSEVLSLRRRGEKTASDERILGSGEFIERLLSEAEEKAKQALGWRGRVPDLQTLLSKISKKEGVEQQKVRGGDQRRSVVSARKVFCRLAVKRMGYSGASVARYLGVTTSLVNRYASSEEVGNLDPYL
jgi:REP-associated tyrosine transposase